ncbi:hypothetical protein VHUM_02201 [Vanrija humicola]|uniref:Adenosine deaminase domain-containing protein n=1 Tax=Vanrija humicola TaxID=5417 RepID=A0A7D8YZY4_VANHU|nr:hypothetical protein VHUM_02201 [Vanrija humicola]
MRRAHGDELGVAPPAAALKDPTHAQGIDAFFAHFGAFVYRIVNTPEALATATRAVLLNFLSDGVAYLELRTTPRALPDTSAEEAVRIVLREIVAWNASDGASMPTRLILSIDRARHDAAAALQIAELALRLKAEGLPVVGLDLCGDPAAPCDLRALAPAFERAREGGLGVVLHFAETAASSTADELDELLSWQPRRLGHAIHVPPPLRERILAAGIAPELCLSCNVLAGMLPPVKDRGGVERAPGIVDHHFGWWWGRGGPLSLGTDDVGVFQATLTDEHMHAATHFGLSRRDMVELSRRAIGSALGSEQDKKRVLALLDSFCRDEGWARRGR